MEARNANNATWFLLRYPENFTPPDPLAPPDPQVPWLDANLFYDDARGVLELLPVPLEREIHPHPGLALDVEGEVYRVDPARGQLLAGCGAIERPLVCEPQVLAGPRGLALDRRGYLYVADARAGRIVVLLPEDGSVRAILDGGALTEPVDVAVSPSGRVCVADRSGGRIVMYSARHQRLGQFRARNAENLPATPRPIAVMVDEDETLLVADANHPRLLRFSKKGKPLADVPLTALTAQLPEGQAAMETLLRLEVFNQRQTRFLVGACAAPRPEADGGVRLNQLHRALRLLRLSLGRRFATAGIFISAALDSGIPGIQWHRIEVDAELPIGTSMTVETAASDTLEGVDLATIAWEAPIGQDGKPLSITPGVPDQLIQATPGRYLWLRVSFQSNGSATPSLRAVRILYPRVSYLDLLPRVYRRDPEGAWFLERFLALFEWLFTRIEDRYEDFSRLLNPEAAPREVIDWLACIIDLSFDPSWPLARRRALVSEAMELYRRRGTVEGLRRYVEIYTGSRPEIQEAFLARPIGPAFLGRRPGSVLGCPLQLLGTTERLPDEQLFLDYAHRFTVFVYLNDPCEAETTLRVVDRIVQVNKPAHTVHTLCLVYPNARVGVQSTVGLDLVVGGKEAPGTRLGLCPVSGAPTVSPVMVGVDTILGERRPSYVRPLIPAL